MLPNDFLNDPVWLAKHAAQRREELAKRRPVQKGPIVTIKKSEEPMSSPDAQQVTRARDRAPATAHFLDLVDHVRQDAPDLSVAEAMRKAAHTEPARYEAYRTEVIDSQSYITPDARPVAAAPVLKGEAVMVDIQKRFEVLVAQGLPVSQAYSQLFRDRELYQDYVDQARYVDC